MELIDRIQQHTGADIVNEPKQVSANVWSVQVGYKDSETTYWFDVKLFNWTEDGEIHIWGF